MQQTACLFEKEIVKTVALQYLLYVPGHYTADESQSFPLVLFLHGSGERGTDIDIVKRNGMPKIVETQSNFPFIVVSPQCPEGSNWSLQADTVKSLLDEVIQHYRVDENRIYLTGLSMGGFGAFDLAMRDPDRYAAIVPVCGGGDEDSAHVIKHVPTWVFHGELDDVVPIDNSKKMVKALQACGGHVRYTYYPDANHDAWTATYDNPELYTWFLQQRRSDTR